MTRQAFIARLREGLRGLPPQAVADIVADYETHFTEGEAAGRTEAEVAAALGDPDRLARELRAEATLARWREERSPSSAAAAIFAVLGLGAIDILILLPILMGIGGALFGLYIAAIAGFFAGGVVFAAAPFVDPPGGPVAGVLAGIGIMAGSASVGAVLTLVTIGLINALVWYGRLHYRLLKPALEPQA
ncbi:conserved hypothetical protein [Phenylobacterium zucineum HLK1]|uniref:DUF1700 domain-containing protein n=1 Tax=Phenylobacterium zucineum (strain HLK1) TaxID=450851 RepID=B4RB08_PHEZH|nr:DUF1700 domain-containing protein [Phenylobacterium zucineum]ACG78059.1 conserved hypothetical protein [Phenylobacterium zucineum HLK1]